MTTPATVRTPIGEYPVEMEGYNLIVKTPPRECQGCRMPLGSDLGFAWTKVFVKECYLYCCACCPHADKSPCPKEQNERKWKLSREVPDHA